jgi:hypothetical protein
MTRMATPALHELWTSVWKPWIHKRPAKLGRHIRAHVRTELVAERHLGCSARRGWLIDVLVGQRGWAWGGSRRGGGGCVLAGLISFGDGLDHQQPELMMGLVYLGTAASRKETLSARAIRQTGAASGGCEPGRRRRRGAAEYSAASGGGEW